MTSTLTIGAILDSDAPTTANEVVVEQGYVETNKKLNWRTRWSFVFNMLIWVEFGIVWLCVGRVVERETEIACRFTISGRQQQKSYQQRYGDDDCGGRHVGLDKVA